MPFDFSELFTAGVREVLPRLRDKKLAFAFDCRGPQLTLPGEPVALHCSLHRLLSGLIELIEVGFLVFDAETGRTPAGAAMARVKLAGTGLPAPADKVRAVLQRLGLQEAPQPAQAGARRASGHCPRTGSPIEFASLGKDGLIFSIEWTDTQAEQWEVPHPADARGAPAWVVQDNVVAARALERRLRRLGWAPRLFASVAQVRQALQDAPGAEVPALLLAVESPGTSPAEFGALARWLPSQTQCVLAVSAGSALLAAPDGEQGFMLRVEPPSPWELHELTERLCEQRHAAQWQPLPHPLLPREQPRLLVVDDNPLTRLIAQSLGEALGYEVASVADGAAALQRCERWAPDVVLMDVHMRPIGGPETTRRLRALQREGRVAPCAVVAATADDSEATREACRDAGMDGHLAKPLLLPAMAAELQRVCAGHGRPSEDLPRLALAATLLARAARRPVASAQAPSQAAAPMPPPGRASGAGRRAAGSDAAA